METLWRRLFFKTNAVRFNPFLPFFTFQNLVIGIFFTLGSYITKINSLVLFEGLDALLPAVLAANIWGGLLVLVFIGHCVGLYYRSEIICSIVAMTGFVLWLYAFWVYLFSLSILALLAIAIPQLYFWGWYFVKFRRYHKDLDAGLIPKIN